MLKLPKKVNDIGLGNIVAVIISFFYIWMALLLLSVFVLIFQKFDYSILSWPMVGMVLGIGQVLVAIRVFFHCFHVCFLRSKGQDREI